MGSVIGKAMDDNMEKQQVIMVETQRSTMARQIQMQNHMREHQMVMQMDRSRDMTLSFGSFYVVAVALIFGPAKSKTKVAPMLPLTFALGYQYQMAYYTKVDRMRLRAEADKERKLLAIPLVYQQYNPLNRADLNKKIRKD